MIMMLLKEGSCWSVASGKCCKEDEGSGFLLVVPSALVVIENDGVGRFPLDSKDTVADFD